MCVCVCEWTYFSAHSFLPTRTINAFWVDAFQSNISNFFRFPLHAATQATEWKKKNYFNHNINIRSHKWKRYTINLSPTNKQRKQWHQQQQHQQAHTMTTANCRNESSKSNLILIHTHMHLIWHSVMKSGQNFNFLYMQAHVCVNFCFRNSEKCLLTTV